MTTDDASLRAALQQVRRRANLVRDAAIALDLEHIRDSELPGLIAALQESFTDLRLMAAEQRARDGNSSEIAALDVEKTRVEWPANHGTAQWPPEPREPRPWLTGSDDGGEHEPGK